MTPLECLARLASIVPPPGYPLLQRRRQSNSSICRALASVWYASVWPARKQCASGWISWASSSLSPVHWLASWQRACSSCRVRRKAAACAPSRKRRKSPRAASASRKSVRMPSTLAAPKEKLAKERFVQSSFVRATKANAQMAVRTQPHQDYGPARPHPAKILASRVGLLRLLRLLVCRADPKARRAFASPCRMVGSPYEHPVPRRHPLPTRSVAPKKAIRTPLEAVVSALARTVCNPRQALVRVDTIRQSTRAHVRAAPSRRAYVAEMPPTHRAGAIRAERPAERASSR